MTSPECQLLQGNVYFYFLRFDVPKFSDSAAEISWAKKIIPAFYILVSIDVKICSCLSYEATIIPVYEADYTHCVKAVLVSSWWPDTIPNINLLIQLWHSPGQVKTEVDSLPWVSQSLILLSN